MSGYTHAATKSNSAITRLAVKSVTLINKILNAWSVHLTFYLSV